jgi:hypothetical protein
VFLAERRLTVGFLGMGAVSPNRPAMIDHPMTGLACRIGSYREPRFEGLAGGPEVYVHASDQHRDPPSLPSTGPEPAGCSSGFCFSLFRS